MTTRDARGRFVKSATVYQPCVSEPLDPPNPPGLSKPPAVRYFRDTSTGILIRDTTNTWLADRNTPEITQAEWAAAVDKIAGTHDRYKNCYIGGDGYLSVEGTHKHPMDVQWGDKERRNNLVLAVLCAAATAAIVITMIAVFVSRG